MASIYQTHKPAAGEGGGLYLKIQDGETVRIRIASEPAIFETENEDKQTGEMRISTRYGWAVWNQDAKLAQVFTQGPRFFNNIAGLAQDDEWGDPTGYDIKIKREGQQLETTYTVTPSANREPLDDIAKDAIAKLDLIEKLRASPFNQRVSWLSDHDNQSDNPVVASVPKQESKPAPTVTPKKDDVVIEDIGDEPVNLDDIPF